MAGAGAAGIVVAMPWQITATIALICFSGAYLAFRTVGNAGASAAAMMLPVMLIGSLLTAGQMLVTGGSLAMGGRSWLLIGAAGLACWIGNLAQLDAVNRSPNPGAALAIVNASVAVVALAAWPLFGTPLSAGKAAGVALCLAGVILVSILP